MSHTYADIDTFRSFLVDGGTAYGSTNDPSLLTLLESASRRVEGYCGRSPSYQSGFGPRTGTNTYDAQGWYGGYQLYADNLIMELEDDLLTATSVTVLDSTGGTSSTITEGTDFYLQPYNKSPKRRLIITGLGQSFINPGLKMLTVVGTWGYATEITATSATMGTLSATATTGTVTGGGVSVGMTLRVDSEDLYVSASTAGTALVTSGGTVTLVRAQNGTTGAVHAAASAISVHKYPREIIDATVRVAQRRWKMRDAGLTGDFGGGGIPSVGFRDTERAILDATVGHLAIRAVG